MASDQTLCRGPETQIRPQASAAETGSPASAQGRAAIASLALPKTRRARPPCGWRKPARARRGMRPGRLAPPPAIPVSHLRSIETWKPFPHRNPARCRIRQRPASRRPALSHCAPWLCKRSSPPGQRGRQRGADAPPLSAPWPAVSPLRAGRRQNTGFSLFRLTYAFRIVIIFLELF